MKKLAIVAALAFGLGGCANLQGIYTLATTATVPAGDVVIAANAFDALNATATNYGNYCVTQHFPVPLCSKANRRGVIKAVNSGINAKHALEGSINSGQPAIATVYNVLIAAVNSLQVSPINTVKGN